MIEHRPEPLRLIRRDPARNMARFYTISILPTLFGEAALVRNWGRIGSHGQVRMETFEEAEKADSALGDLARVKRRRGYC